MTPEQLWAKAVQDDEPPYCWILGVGPRHQYRRVEVDGRKVLAHRLAYELKVGPIPDGYVICHRCDIPACIRPEHLWAGTPRANIRDAFSKGRIKRKRPTKPKPEYVSWPRKAKRSSKLFAATVSVDSRELTTINPISETDARR